MRVKLFVPYVRCERECYVELDLVEATEGRGGAGRVDWAPLPAPKQPHSAPLY